MRLPGISCLIVCLIFFYVSVGCTSLYHVTTFPDAELAKVNATLTFPQILESPDSHLGDTVMLGGEVLEARRLKEHTRLIILQLPIDSYLEPTRDRTLSEGRFVAIQTKFLDPATVPKGTRLTLIGTISGSTTEPLDETTYAYPTLTIHELNVWPEPRHPAYAYYPYRYWPYGPYPYYYRPWIGPYWYY